MVVALKEASIKLLFPDLIDEMRGFVRNKDGKPIHLPGEHDDLLFSVMIAYQAHKRCPMTTKPYSQTHTGESVEDSGSLNDLARIGVMDNIALDEDDDDEDYYATHTW